MGGGVPSSEELGRRAVEQGVRPTEEDLARVREFLEVLLPQLDELTALVPPAATPAAVYRPEVEP